MTKYKQVVQEMFSDHPDIFQRFKEIHDLYTKDPQTNQNKFNEIGQEALRIIQRYENILCSKSEGGKYGKFSNKLSDKYWEEIRHHFPKINFIGVKIN